MKEIFEAGCLRKAQNVLGCGAEKGPDDLSKDMQMLLLKGRCEDRGGREGVGS